MMLDENVRRKQWIARRNYVDGKDGRFINAGVPATSILSSWHHFGIRAAGKC